MQESKSKRESGGQNQRVARAVRALVMSGIYDPTAEQMTMEWLGGKGMPEFYLIVATKIPQIIRCYKQMYDEQLIPVTSKYYEFKYGKKEVSELNENSLRSCVAGTGGAAASIGIYSPQDIDDPLLLIKLLSESGKLNGRIKQQVDHVNRAPLSEETRSALRTKVLGKKEKELAMLE